MDFSTMQDEVFARGFEDLNYVGDGGQTRVKRIINEANQEVANMQPWPDLRKVETGAAPLTLTYEVRHILAVVDSSNDRTLAGADRAFLRGAYPQGLDQAGRPVYYYKSDVDEVSVYPVEATQLDVEYIARDNDMSGDGDFPLLSTTFHPLIVDRAVWKLLVARDQHEAAAMLNQHMKQQVTELILSELVPSNDTGIIVSTNPYV